MQDRRTKNGWSLEILARHISQAGYPISQNKPRYRIEQHLKQEGLQKRPLQTIDYELKIRLEDVLGESIYTRRREMNIDRMDRMVSTKEVVEKLINKMAKADFYIVNPPPDPALRKIFEAVQAYGAARSANRQSV